LNRQWLIPPRKGKIDERFRDIFENLISIRNQLEKLSLTQAWSLRETDLYSYQRRLDRVDEARVDGNFVDANGVSAELYEQRVCGREVMAQHSSADTASGASLFAPQILLDDLLYDHIL